MPFSFNEIIYFFKHDFLPVCAAVCNSVFLFSFFTIGFFKNLINPFCTCKKAVKSKHMFAFNILYIAVMYLYSVNLNNIEEFRIKQIKADKSFYNTPRCANLTRNW